MLELLQMLGLLFKVFALAILIMTLGAVSYVLVQLWLDRRDPHRGAHYEIS